SHAELEAALVPLSEAQWAQVGAADGWTIKDQVAHVAAWQSLAVRWMQQGLRGEPVDRPAQFTDDDINAFNQRLYEKHKGDSSAAVLADLRKAHEKMLAMVASLSDEDINDANRFAWRHGSPLLDLIAGNTYEHYPEHVEAIKRSIG
ncbi:MAG: ClbS/DfsB family four-helix bundle protein, partial [Chloroflexota bacterium]